VIELRQRQPREKNERHLAFVRTLPCCLCGAINVDAAHIRVGSINHEKRSTGMGEKPSDRWVVPLCRPCHTEQHAAGDELRFWASKGIDPFMMAMTLRASE
jgi:hypothetical protein